MMELLLILKAVTTPVGVVSQTNWDPADEMTEVFDLGS